MRERRRHHRHCHTQDIPHPATTYLTNPTPPLTPLQDPFPLPPPTTHLLKASYVVYKHRIISVFDSRFLLQRPTPPLAVPLPTAAEVITGSADAAPVAVAVAAAVVVVVGVAWVGDVGAENENDRRAGVVKRSGVLSP